MHLVRAGVAGDRIVIVDPRTRFERDRTWCFWNAEPHAFESAITRRWARWAVRARGQTVVRDAPGLAYCHVPAERFYAVALEQLRAAGVEIRLGVRAEALDDRGDRVVVATSDGAIEARVALDSRPPRFDTAPPRDDIRLLQHFRGYHVHTAADTFDPETAMLMDFDVEQRDGLAFAYVLPFSEREALVEATWFSAHVLAADAYDSAIRRYLAVRHAVRDFTIAHDERGVIPMTTERFEQRPSPRVYRIGTVGGAAKPSTGYAFLAIQRFARDFAPRLAQDRVPEPPRSRATRTEIMDRVFLAFLRDHASEAPVVFRTLFDRVPPDVLVRFLSETSSPLDELRVMSASPHLRMLGLAARHAPRALRVS